MASQEARGPSAEKAGWGRSEALLFAAAYLIPFLVYLFTLYPSVAGGDSGEITAAAYVLGVPHDTGYPLYMLLLRAWQWLPIGSVAYRSNLFSAVTMAGMCAAWAWVYRRAGGSRSGALLAALAPAFMSITWSEATRAETYGLHALFVAVTLGLFLRWERLRDGRSLVWLALAAGIALSHHRSSLWVVIPFVAVAAARHRPWTVGLAVKAAVALIAPQIAYVYLPLRAAANPPMNWGDIRSWHDFAYHALGGRGTRYLNLRPWGQWVGFSVAGTLVVPVTQMSVAGMGLVVVGAAAAIVKRRDAGLCALVAVVALAGWCSSFGWGEVKWFIPVFMIYGIWLAAGVETVAAGVRRIAGARLARIVRVGALAIFPAILLAGNYAAEDHAREWGPYDWGRILMAELKPNALVALSPDTPLMIGYYMQVVERARPDVQIIAPSMMQEAWVQRQLPDPAMKGLVREAIAAFPGRTFREWSEDWAPYLMGYLVRHYAGTRPVYYDQPLPDLGPGYRTITYQTVYQFARDGPSFLKAGAPRGDFPPVDYSGLPLGEKGEQAAVVLAGARSEKRAVRPGELFRVRMDWRCAREVGLPLEIVALVGPAADQRLVGSELFAGGSSVPLVWGALPLAPTTPGRYYEQRVWYVAPRGLAPGRYVVRVVPRMREIAPRFPEPKPAARLEVVR